MREFLDEQLPGSWIGYRGPTPWPPKSPDLSPLDFFKVFIKDHIYTPPMLQCTWEEFQYRLDTMHNSWCTHWTFTGKTWSISVYIPSYFIIV